VPSTAENFDPYYTWLGIRPEEQPPDHYRLIGLKQFEDNLDVIANAMDRQMQFLRSMQVGKRSAQSQKLLNEISAAGGCLLDSARKSAYDKELKAKEAARAKPAPTKARPLPKATPLVAPLPEADFFSVPMPQQAYVAPARPTPQQQQQGHNTSYLPLILAGAAGGVVLLLLVVIVSGRMFSGGKGTAAKADKSEIGSASKEPEVSAVTAIKKSPVTASDSKSVSREKIEQTPASEIVKPVAAPATSGPAKLPRLPRDAYWKPPGDKGQTKFSAFLGTYSHRDRRDKPYPVVNLQVPANNLWTKEIQQKVQGKIPFEEITYRGLARVNITMEGVYVVDTHPNARFDIYSQKVSGHGEVKLPRGEQNISIEIGSHGGPFLAECSLSMHNKATGEEVQFFSYWEEIQKFLATPIEGQSVTEISGWRPTEESDLRGPMYWWDFDLTSTETADDVEKRFNMKLANWKADEPRLVPGKVGNAVRFHRPEHWGGTWSFTDFPHLTVAFWLKALNEEGANQQILSPWVALNYGKRAGVGVLGMVTEPQPPELGKWYHYAVAVNQETKQVNIYRDGAEVASGRLGNYESQSNTKYWALGHHHDLANHSETLRGELDEVRIYDRLLSQDEVKQVIAIDLARAANAPVTLPPVASPAPTSPPAPTLPLAPARPMLPDPAAVAAARQEVARLFRDDLKAAKTPQARQELAKKMLEIAKATSDRTEKYAMLEEIRKLAEEIKNAALAATALDLEEADFGIDALAEKVKLLEKLSGGTMTPVQRSEILSTAMASQRSFALWPARGSRRTARRRPSILSSHWTSVKNRQSLCARRSKSWPPRRKTRKRT
jgi:hypothetical protein